MKCPFCGYLEDKVVDSRATAEESAVRRRRECLKCSRRFTTYERIESIPFMVVKKDGRREPFQREKLLGQIQKISDFAEAKGNQFYQEAQKEKDVLMRNLWIVLGVIFLLTLHLDSKKLIYSCVLSNIDIVSVTRTAVVYK